MDVAWKSAAPVLYVFVSGRQEVEKNPYLLLEVNLDTHTYRDVRDMTKLKKKKKKTTKERRWTNDDRLFFIGATFGKYLEHYGSMNDYFLDIYQLNEQIFPSVDGELTDWFKQPSLTEEEIDYCFDFLFMIKDRIFQIDDKEKLL